MNTHRSSDLRTAIIALALAVGVALTVAGPGASKANTSSALAGATATGLSAAKKAVARAEAPPTKFRAPGPAFKASAARGKTVWVIAPLSVPYAQLVFSGLDQAAKAAGIKVVKFDGEGTVPKYSQGINQAIARGADLIIESQLPAELFTQDIAKAKQAGIPVVTLENQDPGPLRASSPAGVVASVDQPHRIAGRLMADFTIADSGGKGKVAVIWSSDAKTIGLPQVQGITNEFKRLAPKMQVQVRDVPVARWTSDLPTLTGTLVRDRNLKYLLPLYDGMVLNMLPAVHIANAENRVKIVSFNALPAILTSLKKRDVVAGDVGTSGQQLGWAMADQVLRILTKRKPVRDVRLPVRLFTRRNIGSINLKGSQASWYGSLDFKKAYKKLWGVK